jgi:hypothetical protein
MKLKDLHSPRQNSVIKHLMGWTLGGFMQDTRWIWSGHLLVYPRFSAFISAIHQQWSGREII